MEILNTRLSKTEAENEENLITHSNHSQLDKIYEPY